MTSAAPSFRPAGPLVADPLGAYRGPWNTRLAAHLLRRAAFGGSIADIGRAASGSLGAAVDELVNFPNTNDYPRPELIDTEEQQIVGRRGALTDEERKQRRIGRREQSRANLSWWLNRMLVSPAPLQEKMTLYLHGHFATAENAKGIYGADIIDQNELFRQYALGNWQQLTHGVARDRAMLKWLDNATSHKDHPNENFARELMELFTLGIGNYTETDVRESARAFTGYSFVRRTGQFYFNENQHDDGTKTFLGKTGNFDGDAIVDIIFAQPAAPKYFARRMLEFFVYSDPEDELVDAFANLIRKNNFEMKPVMSTLFRSNVFYSERTYRALVKSPVEFVIGSLKLFGATQVQDGVMLVLQRMGQVPFHPPSVKGWDGGAQWLNTQTVLARENFASSLMGTAANAPMDDMKGPGQPKMFKGAANMQMQAPVQSSNFLTQGMPADAKAASEKLVGTILQGDASPKAMANLQAYLDGSGTAADGAFSGENFEERMRGGAYLTMAMPAYQLS